MTRALIATGLLFAACVALTATAADEKKAEDKKPPESKKSKEAKESPYVKAGQIIARIAAIEESKRSLKLDVGHKTLNPVAAEGIKQARKALAKAKTRDDKLIAKQQLETYAKDLYVNELEVQTTDDVIVRVSQPPAQFDDKGKIKRYTSKELRELKGNSKLPGYQGDFGNLRQNQIVQVTLVKKRDALHARRAKGRDADTELVNDSVPLTNLVIVVRDPNN